MVGVEWAVFVCEIARDALDALPDGARETVIRRLEYATPSSDINIRAGGRRYKVHVVGDWAAVYRRLEPGELGIAEPGRSIVVLDVVAADGVRIMCRPRWSFRRSWFPLAELGGRSV